jgi:hypothetical protein
MRPPTQSGKPLLASKDSKAPPTDGPSSSRWELAFFWRAFATWRVAMRKHRREGWHWQGNLLWPSSFLVIGVSWVSGSILAVVQVMHISELAQFYFNDAAAQFHNERRVSKF